MICIHNDNGVISINSDVFLNLAGDAATKCFGVKGMAGRYKDSAPFQLLKRESMSKGVSVVFNQEDNSVSLSLHIIVDHGVNLHALCSSIIGEVGYKVERATGVPVKQVDVYVDSMLMD